MSLSCVSEGRLLHTLIDRHSRGRLLTEQNFCLELTPRLCCLVEVFLRGQCCMCSLAGTVADACSQRIAAVFDQYLAFIALEAGLFSLGLPDAYLQLNDPGAKDTQIEVRPSLTLHLGLISLSSGFGAKSVR